MFPYHADGSLPNFWGILFYGFLFHYSILSKVGASEKAGAIQLTSSTKPLMALRPSTGSRCK